MRRRPPASPGLSPLCVLFQRCRASSSDCESCEGIALSSLLVRRFLRVRGLGGELRSGRSALRRLLRVESVGLLGSACRHKRAECVSQCISVCVCRGCVGVATALGAGPPPQGVHLGSILHLALLEREVDVLRQRRHALSEVRRRCQPRRQDLAVLL